MHSIWLIEDNLAFRDATQFVLNLHPERYSLKAFVSCEEALAQIQGDALPDVILLDVELPGMDGIEGIQHFKKFAPEVRLLMLTVFEDDEKIFRAICAGASGYLLKSDFDNITSAVDQAIEGGAAMNPRVAQRVLSMFSKMAPVKKDYGLSPREQEVLEWMVKGLPRKQIADVMNIPSHTVSNDMRCIYRKLHVNCQAAAVALAVRTGLVQDH